MNLVHIISNAICNHSDKRLNPELISRNVNVFKIMNNDFEVVLETSSLPCNLDMFYVNGNSFSGSIDMCALPPCLEEFNISKNQFTGMFNFTTLSQTMTAIYAE